jgi:predicted CoA-binding protein
MINNMKKGTLVLGASLKETRYSNLAIKRLREKKIPTVALGLKEGVVGDVSVDVDRVNYKNIDTVTLYLNSKLQVAYYEYVIGLKPRRVIFNPGTENLDFVKQLHQNDIESEIACTLVLLSTNQY